MRPEAPSPEGWTPRRESLGDFHPLRTVSHQYERRGRGEGESGRNPLLNTTVKKGVSYRLAIQYAALGTPKMNDPSPTKTVTRSFFAEEEGEGKSYEPCVAPIAAPRAQPSEEAPEEMSELARFGMMWFQTLRGEGRGREG